MVAAERETGSQRDLKWLLWPVVIAGIVSCTAGVVHAVHRSQDFQWSGERLLLQHIDPWRDFLEGDPAHALIATQVQNYLPVLYVLLVPFGLMSATGANLSWALCNVVFAIASALLAARFYGLRSWQASLGITAALLASTPARTTISNGQQGLLVLVLWSVALLHTGPVTARRAMVAGVSYFKYSFAPALALYLLLRDGLRQGIRVLLWSLVPPALAIVLVWFWLTGGHHLHHLLALTTEPLAVTRVGYQPTGDPGQTFMDLFEFLLGGGAVATPRLTFISLVVAVALTLIIFRFALRKSANNMGSEWDSTGWLLALTAAMSFVLYKHHPYDEVVFLLPFCYALRHWRRPAALATLFLIGYCWYVQPLVDAHIAFSLAWCTARITILFALVLCVFCIYEPHADRATMAAIE